MKHLSFPGLKTGVLLLAVIIAASCGKKQNVITGNVAGLEPGDKVVLTTTDVLTSAPVLLDSMTVTQPGQFQLNTAEKDRFCHLFRFPKGTEVTAKSLNPDALNYRFFLEGYSRMNVTGKIEVPLDWRYLNITGGLYDYPELVPVFAIEDSAKVIQQQAIKLFQSENDSLRAEGRKMIAQSNDLFRSTDSLERVFIAANPDKAYSAALMRYEYYSYSDENDMDKFQKSFLASLSPRVQGTPAGEEIRIFIERRKASMIGGTAIDFDLPSIDGQRVKLSDYKGKYVLLDFWGSWCGPCRASSPKLVAFHEKIAANDSIVMISIACRETDEANWKEAVQADNLTWTQLIDMNQGDGVSVMHVYSIDGVPTCILISPEGKILMREHPVVILPQIEQEYARWMKK